MMLDRSQAPQIGKISMPALPQYEVSSLPNGAMLYVMRGGEIPMARLDVYVPAGHTRSSRALVSRATANMLVEGTPRISGVQLSDKFEFFGSYYGASASIFNTVFSSVFLSKDLMEVASLVRQCVLESSFPDHEFEVLKSNLLQAWKVNCMKTKFLAACNMAHLLYAEGDRFGRTASQDDYMNLSPEMLRSFHAECYDPAGACIFLGGQVSDADIAFVARLFGSDWHSKGSWSRPTPAFAPTPKTEFVNFDSQQTSLKMCRPVMNVDDPDYMKFLVVDAILGGYFGSRLMQNLRERLGLTYGIRSCVNSESSVCVHSIDSEIRSGEHQRALDEIRAEIVRLRSEPVPMAELETVRGFLLGELLTDFSNFYSAMDIATQSIVSNRPLQRHRDFYDQICSITPDEILSVARKWLDPDAYFVSIVGK